MNKQVLVQVLLNRPSVGRSVCLSGALWTNGWLDLHVVWCGWSTGFSDEVGSWGWRSSHAKVHCWEWIWERSCREGGWVVYAVLRLVMASVSLVTRWLCVTAAMRRRRCRCCGPAARRYCVYRRPSAGRRPRPQSVSVPSTTPDCPVQPPQFHCSTLVALPPPPPLRPLPVSLRRLPAPPSHCTAKQNVSRRIVHISNV